MIRSVPCSWTAQRPTRDFSLPSPRPAAHVGGPHRLLHAWATPNVRTYCPSRGHTQRQKPATPCQLPGAWPGPLPCPRFRPAQPAGSGSRVQEWVPLSSSTPAARYFLLDLPQFPSTESALPRKQNLLFPGPPKPPGGALQTKTGVGLSGGGVRPSNPSWLCGLGWSPSIITSLCLVSPPPLAACSDPPPETGMGAARWAHSPGSRSHPPVSSAAPR